MIKKYTFIAACTAFLLVLSVPVFADYDVSVIQQVQQALNDAGFNCGTPDGVAGKMTADAVRAYQEANSLTVDGQITDELLASLGIGDVEGAGSEEPAAAEVSEDTAETNDADGLLFDSSKFDETLYEGKWFTIERDSAEKPAYEIYIPADWTTEDSTPSGESTEFTMPEEFSDFQFGCAIMPTDELGTGGLDFVSVMSMAFGIDSVDKISINGIDDAYYGGMYDESHFVDDAGSVFPEYDDVLFIPEKEDECFILIGRYMGGFEPPKEGQVEAFMNITRNIMSSLRIAGTEEEAAS